MLLPDPSAFLDQIFSGLTSAGVAVEEHLLDHICYRVASPARYAALKQQLLTDNELLAETLINGRPISTFRLLQPLKYKGRTIELLELPSPKPGSPYPEGYEHVEFAVGQAPDLWMQQYPGLAWETKDLQKTINPDIRLQISTHISVKFHEYPLDYVIKYLDQAD